MADVSRPNAEDFRSANADVARLLECPVCLKFMDKNIFMCESGHPLCGDCNRISPNCPTCQKPFFSTRVLTLEHISQVVYRQCDVEKCEALITTAQRDDHKPECTERYVSCKACEWRDNLSNVYEHITSDHPPRDGHSGFQLGDTITISEPVETLRQEGSLAFTHAVDDCKNVFAFELRNKGGCIWFCAKLFDTKRNAAQFRIQVSMKPSHPDREEELENFKTTTSVHNDLERPDGQCVPLSAAEIIETTGWVDEQNILNVNCRITRRVDTAVTTAASNSLPNMRNLSINSVSSNSENGSRSLPGRPNSNSSQSESGSYLQYLWSWIPSRTAAP